MTVPDPAALLQELTTEDIDRVLAERSMHEFIKQSWSTIEP